MLAQPADPIVTLVVFGLVMAAIYVFTNDDDWPWPPGWQ